VETLRTAKDKGERIKEPCSWLIGLICWKNFDVSRIPETSKRPVTSFCRIAELNGITQTPGDGGA